MSYYIISSKVSIKPIFKGEDEKLIICPEIGLGEAEEAEEQISIPIFIKNIENILGTYRLKTDGFFYKLLDEMVDDLFIRIDIVRRFGTPSFKFKVLEFEGILFLPSIKVINQKRPILYSYLHIPKKLPGLEGGLKKYLLIDNLNTASFNYGAINYTGDESIRKNLNLENLFDPETGFTRKCEVTENQRLQLKQEFNFILLFKMIANLIEKKNIFEGQFEQARSYAKEVELTVKQEAEEAIMEEGEMTLAKENQHGIIQEDDGRKIQEKIEFVKQEMEEKVSIWKMLAENMKGDISNKIEKKSQEDLKFGISEEFSIWKKIAEDTRE